MVHCIYQGVTGENFQTRCASAPEYCFLANSVDPDEMPHSVHSVAFHLGLHCLTL